MTFLVYIILILSEICLSIFSGSAAAVMLLILTLFLFVVSSLLNLILTPKIKYCCNIPKTAKKSEIINGILKLQNDLFYFYSRAEICLEFFNSVTGEKSEIILKSLLLPKAESVFQFKFKDKFCGEISIRIKKIKLYDSFGFFYKNIDADCVFKTVILPNIYPINYINYVKMNSKNTEEYADKKGDDLSEIYSLRDYQNGDSIKSIHYKLSASSEKLVVKEGTKSNRQFAILIVDTFVNCESNLPQPEKANDLIEKAVSICFQLCKQKRRFKLAFFNCDKYFEYNIENENDFYSVLPKILSISFCVSELTAEELILSMPQNAGFDNAVCAML